MTIIFFISVNTDEAGDDADVNQLDSLQGEEY
jgi:hypothetical protein